mmetsp:Transcript_15864/g.43432  ORF Transcript_15864/g.43432 Transcript_15864/m.43432 type:complete len:227 (-) Transcript_15864:213-893(-)
MMHPKDALQILLHIRDQGHLRERGPKEQGGAVAKEGRNAPDETLSNQFTRMQSNASNASTQSFSTRLWWKAGTCNEHRAFRTKQHYFRLVALENEGRKRAGEGKQLSCSQQPLRPTHRSGHKPPAPASEHVVPFGFRPVGQLPHTNLYACGQLLYGRQHLPGIQEVDVLHFHRQKGACAVRVHRSCDGDTQLLQHRGREPALSGDVAALRQREATQIFPRSLAELT